MKTYIYRGTRDANSNDAPLTYTDDEGNIQGAVRSEGAEPTVAVGDEIKLPVAEAERLSPWFIFEDVAKSDDDIGDGLQSPTTQGVNTVVADPSSESTETKDEGDKSSTSSSGGTIPSKAKTSGTSSK